jgi:hypothetical protein
MNTAYIGLGLMVVLVLIMAYALYVELTELKPRYYTLMDLCPCWCPGAIDNPPLNFTCVGNHSPAKGNGWNGLEFLNYTGC